MQSITVFTDKDKSYFYKSLIILKDKLDDLVQSFYKYFLQTEAGNLFNLLDMEKQYKMFRVSIAILISHIDNPYMLEKHLKLVIENHQTYGLKRNHIELFLSSFNFALQEVFLEDKKSIQIWTAIMTEIMFIFEEEMNFD